MKKVFVVQKSGHDFSDAERFGELAYMFEDKINVFASDGLVQDIKAKLKGATEDDYLVLSGNTIACCISYAHLLKELGKVNVLLYSFRSSCYELRTIRDSGN